MADTLANLTPHPWYVALHYSHPPVGERVRALEACDCSPFDPQIDRTRGSRLRDALP